MYAIIYIPAGDEAKVEIRQILNSSINPDSWNTGDSALTFLNCEDEDDLLIQLAALDPNWGDQFERIYIKK